MRLRMRSDLTAAKHRYQGRTYWVVKEPVGLQYFRFQEEEYAVLEMLDGEASLEEIQAEFQSRFPPQKITLGELQQFIGMLHGNGLLICESPRQGEQLKRRADEKWYKELWSQLANVLALRFKGIDPDWLLEAMYPYISWFFTWTALFACLAYGFAALMLVLVNWDTFQAKLPAFDDFFGAHNWLWLALTLAVVKILHEFGHGLSCKHFGGECHEMGVMLLVLTPCLYCNVSDSWMLPNKWARAAIGAAGMYVELVIASTATFIWWFSEPGLLNFLCLRVMFICSVSTVMFNGNPLLRYDGYYIISDIMEIPNLQQKSSDVLRHLLSKYCLGLDMPDDPFLPQDNQFFFALYTIASGFYRWLVFFSILLMMNSIFEPYGLKIIGQLIAFSGVVGLIVMPIWQVIQFLNIPGRMDQVKSTNVLTTIGVVAAVVAAIVFVPLPHWVRCPVEVRPRDPGSVFVMTPGRLEAILAQPGDWVEAGAPLARLRNMDLELTIAELEQKERESMAQYEALESTRVHDPDAALQIPQVLETLRAVRDQLVTTRKDLNQLTLTAPRAGMVIPTHWKINRSRGDEMLPDWTGLPTSMQNQGAYLQASEQFCQIGNAAEVEVVAVIDQADVDMIREKMDVEIKFPSYAGEIFSGQVKQVAKMNLKATPEGLTSDAGGDIATKADPSGKARPLSTSYQAVVPLDDPDARLKVGMRGNVRIYTDWQPLWNRIWRYLTQTFHFRM